MFHQRRQDKRKKEIKIFIEENESVVDGDY